MGIKNSEKWKLAKEQKLFGNSNNRKHSEETKKKISESVKNTFHSQDSNNIEKHRQIMSEVKGVKVQQCDTENNIINTYMSCSEASRQTGISKASINNGIKDPTKIRCGFIWKRIE